MVAGGGAARYGEPGPAAAAVRGGPPQRPAGPPAAVRAAAVPRGAEDENVAEEALQGLLHRPAAGPAVRVLQDQPPAQAEEAVARWPGALWRGTPRRGEDGGGVRRSGLGALLSGTAPSLFPGCPVTAES